MTASWLVQMGWNDVHVLEPEGADGFAGWELESGPRGRTIPSLESWATISPDAVRDGPMTVVDLSSSLRYRDRHIPGAWWAVRSRLAEAQARLPGVQSLVLTSEDGLLAQLAAPEAAALWTSAGVRVLQGGNAAWFAAGLATESGLERVTTANDDVSYKPYDHKTDYEKHARDYLSWEVELVQQIQRDPTIRFRKY
jgi:rhodanese-related sulfurtransferase